MDNNARLRMDNYAQIDDLQNNKNDTSYVVESYLKSPGFIEQKLSPFYFDPSKLFTSDLTGADVENRCELYDEPDNKTFNRYLQAVVHQKDVIAKEYKNVKIEEMISYNAIEFFAGFRNRLFAIANEIMIIAEISTRWGYKIKDLHVVRVFRIGNKKNKDNSNIYWVNMEICVHKTNRVYGKAITIHFFFDTRSKAVRVAECNLSGIVPQEYIKGVVEEKKKKEKKEKDQSNVYPLGNDPNTNEYHIVKNETK